MYLLKISYSWGDEESDIPMNSFEEAWEYAKKLAKPEEETANNRVFIPAEPLQD